MAAIRPGINNSKKISELRPRDIITYHQQDSWIPLAQYNCRTGSYTNIAINIKAITDYSAYTATAYTSYWIDTHRQNDEALYKPAYWVDLLTVGEAAQLGYADEHYEDIGYATAQSAIASNLVSYTFSYTVNYFGWQYFLGRAEDVQTDVQYLFTELGNYLLTDDGRKIII